MSINERLEAYRRKKRREKMTETIKSTVVNALPWNRNDGNEESARELTKDEEVKLCEQQLDIQDTEDIPLKENAQESKSTVLITKVIYLLYFLLWITLYAIALKYEFGAVYFVLSALLFICLNTRSGPKQRGEPSAYSVFNPNCEAIEGTLDASQFEREIRYGIGATR
ncbi:Uncharacterized protein C6orf64 [Camponotus floridanus]|uniref:Uncharacterized protein C6orf64 n=1 Tax=Camponotus floridanus TaxID=104421 RepID=E2AI34_CAMFO|nr:SAYSvFN domain-containing protein 1 isoform X1 [Camponotus floridanus]EFN66942.1 Uncharacterized protein C6orf64 [Camponotus floridanus]